MGWSCRKEAGETMDAWSRACVAQTGESNRFVVRGVSYFFECDNVEHDDGAITGTLFRMTSPTECVEASQFRIGPEGQVERAPAFLRGVTAREGQRAAA